MTKLLIARHGNTFDQGDRVVRVGRQTDLPLSNSGKQQAMLLGRHLKTNEVRLSAVFTSTLQRTIQTAQIMLEHAQQALKPTPLSIFDEIDYGIDEGKTDPEIIDRIGAAALQAWDAQAIVPPGWVVDPAQIIAQWQDFAAQILDQYIKQTVMIVTSNGIARFAPHLTGDFAKFSANYNIKLGTGCLSALSAQDAKWSVEFWNKKPG